MADVQRIVLIPRYTSLVGPGTFYFPAVNVREFCHADVSFWRGNEFGIIGVLQVRLEASPDLATWSELASFTAAAGSEDCEPVNLTMDWLRPVVCVQGGTYPAFTCWSVGDFERRQSPSPAGGRVTR
jgi:hypothetical protein